MDLHSQALADVFGHLLPEIVLAVVACVLFIGGTVRANRHLWGGVALAGLLAALFIFGMPELSLMRIDVGAAHGAQLQEVAAELDPIDRLQEATIVFGNPVLFDSLTSLVRLIALGGGILLLLFSWNELPDRQASDHHACLLIIVAGVALTAAANDLVTLFLALELISIPTYIVLYLPRHDEASQEAALKYFLLSIFSSALLLFGFSYLYGLTGTTNISAILHTLNSEASARALPVIAQVALIMVVAGLGFRITAAPFHFYAPDVYQGAPTAGAALLAFIPKVAGFAALLRVLGFVMPEGVPIRNGLVGMGLSDQVPILFWFLAVITMFLGNIMALLQDNIKRLLAYSSVAHAGYMLVALASAPYLSGAGGGPDGVEALLFYLVAYGAMTIGAFAVVSFLSTPERPIESVDDLAGLSKTHPGTALMMAVFLFSLIGIPLTAGFTGKFLIFFGAMAVPGDHEALALPGEYNRLFIVLALLGMVNAAIGGWYYLRIVAIMYLRTALRPIQVLHNAPMRTALALCVILTVGLSIPPAANWLLDATRGAAGNR